MQRAREEKETEEFGGKGMKFRGEFASLAFRG